jgi:hypothetical protein
LTEFKRALFSREAQRAWSSPMSLMTMVMALTAGGAAVLILAVIGALQNNRRERGR